MAVFGGRILQRSLPARTITANLCGLPVLRHNNNNKVLMTREARSRKIAYKLNQSKLHGLTVSLAENNHLRLVGYAYFARHSAVNCRIGRVTIIASI